MRLILSHQIAAITELAERHPRLAIMLDHAAKPRLGDADAMLRWARDIEKLAALPNVACKVSGLLTELTPSGTRDDVARAIGVLFDLFGPQRLVWGSDWPVLTLAGTYPGWFDPGAGSHRRQGRERASGRDGRQCRAALSAAPLDQVHRHHFMQADARHFHHQPRRRRAWFSAPRRFPAA